MATYDTLVSADKVKLKYRERYVTEGENERSLAYPHGCYRGFVPEDSAVPDKKIHLKIDPLGYGDLDSFIVCNDYVNGWSISIRETADFFIDLDGSAFTNIPAGVNFLYVYVVPSYVVGQTTVVYYRVSDVDPTAADPNTVVIGKIPVTAGQSPAVISFDISQTATQDIVFAPRTLPGPTAVEELGTLAAGDRRWGYYDAQSAWRTPTTDEKKAMTNANSPDATNPFATVDETRDLYEGEWTSFDVTINTASNDVYGRQKIALSGDWYIGDGARASDGARYFKIHSKDSLVMGYDASFALDYGGIRPIRVYNTAGTTALTPSSDSDTEGFYTNPQLQVYMDTEQALTQGFTITGYKKKTHGTKAQAPVDAIDFASGHAQNISIKRIPSPPIWGETSITLDDTRNGLQDVVHDLHKRSRGPSARTMSGTNLNMGLHKLTPGLSGILHGQGGCDTHPYAPENSFPLFFIPFVDGTSVGPPPTRAYSVRKILPWRVAASGPKIIVVGLDNDGPIGGPSFALMDPSTGVYTVKKVTGDLPASTRWMLQDICVDNEAVYVRVSEESAGSSENRVLKYVLGVTLDIGWPAGGSLLYTESGGSSDVNIPRMANLINANAGSLAANDHATEIAGTGGSVGGVIIIDKTDGSLTANGTGDFVTHGSSPIPAGGHSMCLGPIVSDGTNIYFSSKVYNSSWIDQGTYVASCAIAAPASSNATAGWTNQYVGSLTGGFFDVTPIWATDLIFDGYHLWMFSGDPLDIDGTRYSSVTQGTPFHSLYKIANLTGYTEEKYGPAVFDGKDIWHLSMNKDVAVGTCYVNRLSARGGVQDYVSAGSINSYATMLKDRIGASAPGWLASIDTGGGTFAAAAMAFDGEDIWYSLEGSSDGDGVLAGYMFRIPNVKDI